MRYLLYTNVVILLLIFSCKESINKIAISTTDTLQNKAVKSKNKINKTIDSIPKNIKPVFGYRFVITGDFNGDGKKETITEHFYSKIDNKESNKFYDSLIDYSQLVEMTIKKKPYSFVTCNDKSINTLHISSAPRQLGLSYLKNEGDLNGDGTDEISYVVNWADWSNCNTWQIMTYKNNRWQELYSFEIWDWQLPDLPKTFSRYGLMGLENKINISNDTINQQIEENFKKFKGLVKKIKTNKIRIVFRNKESDMDTIVVKLKRLPTKRFN